MSAFSNIAPITAPITPPQPSPGATGDVCYESEWIDAAAMVPATTNGPEAEKKELAGGTNVDRLLFDGATIETAYVKWIFDESWDRGKIRFRLVWDANTGGSGTASWGVSARAVSNDDALDAAFPTDVVVTDTVTSVGDNHTTSTVEVTVGGDPQIGCLILLRIRRRPDIDSMTQDAGLLGAHVQWRENRTAQVWS